MSYPPENACVLHVSKLPFDLQLFAGEKTEPATEKRREEARLSGNIAKSQDIESVAVMIMSFLILRFYGSQIIGLMGDYMRYTLGNSMTLSIDPQTLMKLFSGMLVVTLKCLFPVFLVIMVTAVATNIAQVGFMLSSEPLLPDLNKINPISGFQNLFSKKAVGELVKSIFKIAVVSYIPYTTMLEKLPFLLRFIQLEPMPSMIFLGDLVFWMALKILLALLFLALLDYWYQWWIYEESLMMSKEEIKEEYKQREGDPKVKQKIRERQRKIATSRMMSEVPKATVVVTNPTHIAIAISYEEESSSAPLVVAMGTGLTAQRIKEIAKEHDVPIVENKPLAQALHKMVDVGDEIPQELYKAVAEILAQVWRMKGKVN
ncbi:MAG: flagellar biosynthesis protein FlhB [Candidatus Riflebacteria bacterium]|nr:flagellar biosynthesis protein FlhB [Candidatus Riflebacteria bacterium]